MSALLRLIFVVPLAYICSCAATGLTIYAAWQSTGTVFDDTQFELMLGGIMVAMAFAAVAFPLSLIGIILAEAFAIRTFIWFVLLGMFNGYILSWTLPELPTVFIYSDVFERAAFQNFEPGTTAYLAGGSAFGLIYWVLVGRLSGSVESHIN